MKKIGFLRFGVTFAGCFLGAGYVSGQELWQFFGSFGSKSISGLILALVILFSVSVITVLLNRRTGIVEADKLVVMWDSAFLRGCVAALELIFLFGVCMIMSAGVGALINQLFGIPFWIGSLLFIAIVTALSLLGFEGMVSAFSVTVPILIAATLIFGIYSVAENGFTLPAGDIGGKNPLMGSWLIAAISFACYNLFGTIAIISPLGGQIKSRRTVFSGIALGTVMLFVIALSVLVSVSASREFLSAELPMLALAQSKAAITGYAYGLLLLLAMFGTSLSSLVAFTNLIYLKSEKLAAKKLPFAILCAVLIFLGSLFGFGDLIGTVYPIFGYLSSIFIVLLVVHYIKVR